MPDPRDAYEWARWYVDSRNRAVAALSAIDRRAERNRASLKLLLDSGRALAARAPGAIGRPATGRAPALAAIAGAAWAARDVLSDGSAVPEMRVDEQFVAWHERRSAMWGGNLASGLMAASDGALDALMPNGTLAELDAAAKGGKAPQASWLGQPAYEIEHAAAFLAELNAAARPRPDGVHEARAAALNQEIAAAGSGSHAAVSAHAWAVHELTGVYGPGVDATRRVLLGFVATYPPHQRAALRASKVAALLADGLGPRARAQLLDRFLVLLGPDDGDPAIRMGLARDAALVLILLEDAAGDHKDLAEPTTADTHDVPDLIAGIAAGADRAVAAAAAKRLARYQRAAKAGSLVDAFAVITDALSADDHEQAWSLLADVAGRHADADPSDLVVVAPDVLGPVGLDGDGDFEGPGAGVFTVLSPTAAAAAAAVDRIGHRLLAVDHLGMEHPDVQAADDAGAYTPNYLHEILWSDYGAAVTLDTKGVMWAAMGRTMVSIITEALVADAVPAVLTGWNPRLNEAMVPWRG